MERVGCPVPARKRGYLTLLVGIVLFVLLAAPRPACAAHPAGSPRLVPPPAGDASAPITSGKVIIVRIAAQRAAAVENGKVVYDFPVSTGRNGNTAVGNFRVLDKIPAPKNAQWGYTMPLWMGVYWAGEGLENGFHALPVLPDGSELWASQIGSPASDGCIVLRRADMQQLYDWAEVGTPVVIEP